MKNYMKTKLINSIEDNIIFTLFLIKLMIINKKQKFIRKQLFNYKNVIYFLHL